MGAPKKETGRRRKVPANPLPRNGRQKLTSQGRVEEQNVAAPRRGKEKGSDEGEEGGHRKGK